MQAKKGDLSINFIIVAALALIVLIAVALFFTGGIKKLFGTSAGTTGVTIDPQVRALSVQQCKLHCSLENSDAYNNPNFPEEVRSKFANCADLLGTELEYGNNAEFSTTCVGSCSGTSTEQGKSCDQKTQSQCSSVPGCTWS